MAREFKESPVKTKSTAIITLLLAWPMTILLEANQDTQETGKWGD
jgi:hypothetical protein